MVAAAVTPSSVEAPAASSSPVAPPASLFNTVHQGTHATSDWDHFDDCPVDDDIYLLAEELAKEQLPCGVSADDRPTWKVGTTGKDVVVTLSDSRETVWTIAQEEINAYRIRVKELSGKTFDDIDPIKGHCGALLGKVEADYAVDGVCTRAFAQEGMPLPWHLLCPESTLCFCI